MNKLNIEYILLDIDGTLLTSAGHIMPKTKQVLTKLQKSGIRLILVSGRPLKSMMKVAKELGIDNHFGIIVSNNGAVAYDLTKQEILFQSPLDKIQIKNLLEEIEDREIFPMVEEGEYMIVRNVFDGVIDTGSHVGGVINVIEHEARQGDFLLKEVRNIAQYVDFDVNKVLTIVDPKKIGETVVEFREKFKGKMDVFQTSPYFMEFMVPNVNKANGLRRLGINFDNCIAFGDSMNDIEMLKAAKYSVAMGNADERVKAAAGYVTKSNNEEGIYFALEELGFIE